MTKTVRILAILFFLAMAACSSSGTGSNTVTDQTQEPTNNGGTTQNEKVSFIAFGDWGTADAGEKAVAAAVASYCKTASCEFIVTLGDNFQKESLQSTADPLWKTTYTDIYGPIGIPFYASLGNHDQDSAQVQIDYSNVNSYWYMPAKFYSFAMPADSETPIIEYFVLNGGDSKYSSDEESWFENAVAASRAKWKFLIHHKPMLSNGDDHGDYKFTKGDKLINDTCGKIDLVLSGHDHIFSYLVGKSNYFTKTDCEVNQLVIGTGGYGPYGIKDDPRAIASGAFNGFGWFEASKDQINFKMIKTDGSVFYETSWKK